MSRAFTKEDDRPEEPILPVHRDGPVYLSAASIGRLRERLVELERTLRERPPEDPQRDRLRRELLQTQADLEAATPIERTSGDRVSFGARVTLRLSGGQTQTIEVVGDDEVDPARGKIGRRSPLSEAIFGLPIGATAVWHRPAGDVGVTIERIDALP